MKNYLLSITLIFLIMVATARGDELEESCVRNRTDCERSLIDRNKQLCGTDNVTYINKCFLEMEVCRGNQIAIKHMGRCRNKQPCFKDIKKLQREQKVRKINGSFIPTCLKDGRYSPVQCHKETRYCWCVTPRGRPIPNTSKLNQKPNCAKRFKTRRRASARKSDREFCNRSDKLKFNENLLNLFRAEYGKDISGDEDPAYINQKILNWKFESIDRNDDDFLQRPEYRILRRLKKLVKPKKCAKTFAKLCDMDHDLRISKEEWSACLGENNIPLKTGAVASLSGQLPGFEHFKRKDEPEANDCFSDRQAVLSEQRSNNLYVPECTQDGRYNRIQCYKSTGYCWCVHEDDGKPIPGTSVKDQSPKCDSIPVPVRPMKGCPGEKKEIFLNDLMDFLNWKKFLTNLSSLNLCTSVSETYQDKDFNQISQLLDDSFYNATNDNNVASITLFASVQLVRELKKLPSNSLAVSGSFDIAGWLKSCYGKNSSSSTMNISFVVPQDLTQSNFKDVCILLTGPLELLPFGRRSQLCTPSTINRTSAHIGTIRSVNSNNTESFCKDGSLLRLNYSNEWDEKFYLSKQERGLIYLRLIHASYFLFVIAVTFVCYSFIRGRQNGSLPAVDKVNI